MQEREKVLISHEYDLNEKDFLEGTLPQWKALALKILMNWAKSLYYYQRRKENPKAPIPYEFYTLGNVDKVLEELEQFTKTEVCYICEKLANVSCSVLYEKVVEYMKTHTQCQKNKGL